MAKIIKAKLYEKGNQRSILVEFDNGVCKELYRLICNKIIFDDQELIGLTESEAIKLLNEKENKFIFALYSRESDMVLEKIFDNKQQTIS